MGDREWEEREGVREAGGERGGERQGAREEGRKRGGESEVRRRYIATVKLLYRSFFYIATLIQ